MKSCRYLNFFFALSSIKQVFEIKPIFCLSCSLSSSTGFPHPPPEQDAAVGKVQNLLVIGMHSSLFRARKHRAHYPIYTFLKKIKPNKCALRFFREIKKSSHSVSLFPPRVWQDPLEHRALAVGIRGPVPVVHPGEDSVHIHPL